MRLSPEPREPLGIVRDSWKENLDRDVAIQLGIVGSIHLTHAADPKGGENLKGAEMRAGR